MFMKSMCKAMSMASLIAAVLTGVQASELRSADTHNADDYPTVEIGRAHV